VRACACVLNAHACVHSLSFERIITKFAGNILLLTISVKDYVFFSFTHRAHACEHACARACVIKHSLIYGPTLFKFAVNILQITISSMGYVLFMFTHRTCVSACVRARAWLKHSLIFGRILFKCAGHIQQMTTSYIGYIYLSCSRIAGTRASERACASERVINCSLIYGRFLFKFGVNILHITISSMDYVHFMFSHRMCAGARVRARAWLKHSLIFGRIFFKFAGQIQQMTTSYMGYIY
jgi:hypothetical protein